MNARNTDLRGPAWLALGLGLALAGALSLDQASQSQRAWRGLPSPMTRPIPTELPPETLLAGFGGEARMGADWRYIDALQYLGNNANIEDGFFRRTAGIYDCILWVDPGFRHAVREGAAVVGWVLKRPRQAAELLTRALAYDADSAPASKVDRDRYRTYLAALAYQQLKDDQKLLDTLREEAKREDAPEMLLRMLGNVYLRNKDYQGALVYWTWVRSRAKEWQTLAVAQKAIQSAKRGLADPGRR